LGLDSTGSSPVFPKLIW